MTEGVETLCSNCGARNFVAALCHQCRQSLAPTPYAPAPPAIVSTDLLGWLRGKLADAERTLAAREAAAAVWKSGTDKEWAESAKLHPDTAKEPPLTKAARMENARREERILVKCRRDVEMFKAVISALSHPNGALSGIGGDDQKESRR
jgi:hypothetical protein